MKMRPILAGGVVLSLCCGLSGGRCYGATLGTDMVDLVVNNITGDAQLQGGSTATLSTYEIHSNAGSLVSGNLLSLSGHYSVSGWSVWSSSANDITEATFGTVSPAITGTTIDLGDIFTPNGTRDLTLYCADINGVENDGYTNGVGGTANVTYTGVPEPASLSLLALGALGLIARRRSA